MERVDLAVIGGGTAGLVASAGAAMLGARAALFERDALGGECLWTGCVPTKALVRSANVYHLARNGGRLGLPVLDRPVEFGRVMDRMRSVRAAIEPHDSPERFRGLGVDVVLEDATIPDHHVVRSATRTVHARRILIATGSRAAVPPVEGLEEAGFLTHVTALELDRLPESLAIIGAGVTGLEFAQIFSRLGARVTVLERNDRILVREDPELAAMLRRYLEREGIEIRTSVRLSRVRRDVDGLRQISFGDSDQILTVQQVLVAAGRRPNVEGLGLERLGVEMNDDGVAVDDALRTSVDHVYAAGDITGRHQFTHVADYEARLVVANALVPLVTRRADYRAVPRVVYTDPEFAHVGSSEMEAREAHGDAVQVHRYGLEELDRAMVDGDARGVVKLIAGRRGRLLGAGILARGAGDMIAAPALAVRKKLKLSDIAGTIHAYPTMPEAVRRAAEGADRQRLEGFGGSVLKRVVRWAGVG